MASGYDLDELGPERREEGARFTDTLARLGLLPEVACWFQDTETAEFRFALVSSTVDLKGSRPLHVVLEKAYRAAAITVDPLIVELFSPFAAFSRALKLKMPLHERAPHGMLTGITVDGREVMAESGEAQLILDRYAIAPSWVYKANWHRRNPDEIAAEFNQFKQRVGELIALSHGS